MKSLFFPLAAVMASAMPSSAIAQYAQPPLAGTRLDVTARGEVRRVPDIAVISAGVVTNAADAASAMRANAARMTGVIAALRSAGIAEKDIATTAISLSPQYRYEQNEAPKVVGYQASNQVTVRFREIGRSGAILDALVREGANQISGPSMMIDKPEAAQDEARIEAMKAARARAELYARAAGMAVKRIVSISESDGYSPGPTPVMVTARMADAAPKTEVLPGEQGVGITLSVVFELQ